MNVSQTEKIRSTASSRGPHVKYLVRRETHSSRAVLSSVVALIMIAALSYVVVEAILSMTKSPKLLAKPAEMWRGFTQITSAEPMIRAIVTGVAIVLILLGCYLLGKALLPGMLGRHSINDARTAYIVDDGVVASNVSRKVRETAGVPAGQLTTSVAKRSVEVLVTPTSGYQLDQTKLTQQARDTVEALNLRPAPNTRLRVAKEGKVAK